MKITNIKGVHPDVLQGAIWTAIHQKSRFTVRELYVGADYYGNANSVVINGVRVFKPKLYCGNHPNACEGPEQKHVKRSYLEGADWVEFNDLLNNVLDELGASATIRSTTCVIRKGALRRTRYWSFKRYPLANHEWEKDEPDAAYWIDNRGQGPMTSTFPQGTPGIHTG